MYAEMLRQLRGLLIAKKKLVLKNALVKMHDLCIIFLNKQGYMYT